MKRFVLPLAAALLLSSVSAQATQQGVQPTRNWKQAENCANYLGKGSLAAVDGRIQVRTYDAKDGQRRWVTEVVADTVRFLDKRGEGRGADSGVIGADIGFTDEDIPF